MAATTATTTATSTWMPANAAGSGTRTVEEQFLDLVCSDPDLLAAEFDAIISAGWTGERTDERRRPLRQGSVKQPGTRVEARR